MSDFEYTDLSDDGSDDENPVIPSKSKLDNPYKVSKELRLHYASLFIDSFNLIDSFVKSKKLSYDSFLEHFDSMKFHQIYAKAKKDVKQKYVSPHHYISTTQDALAVASKFLRSHSREARIGAVYLLYTLHKTQPLKPYPINVKMEPKDYNSTKELVDKCLNEGLLHPAYCFYDLDMRRKITLTASSVIPCLEANYPRLEVRKHLGRAADKYFKIEYEERLQFNSDDKLLLMERQMRDELAYINKLSNLALNCDVAPDYKAELTTSLAQIKNTTHSCTVKQSNDVKMYSKKGRYKTKKSIAFPGKTDDVLEDMVIVTESEPIEEPINNFHPRKKLKLSKKKQKTVNKNKISESFPVKEEPEASHQKLSEIINSDSSCSSTEDPYGSIIQDMIDGNYKNELIDLQS